MKGTLCGNRALALVVLLISFAAVAPAVANADVLGSTPAPAASAVPAVPAVPAPAVPSLGAAPVQVTTPVASATVAPATPSVAVTAPATTVAVTPTSGNVHVATPGTKVVKAVGVAESAAIKVVDASAAKVTKPAQGVKQFGVKVTRIASGMVIKLVPATVKKQSVVVKKKAGRVLADNWGDDDWQSGCTKGTYTGCSQTPVGPIDNRCYQTGTPLGTTSGTATATDGTTPPFSATEQVMFTQGTQTTWTRTKNVYKNIAGVPTLVGVIVEMKSFIRGLYGTAPSGTIYRSGKDTSTQWSAFLPLDASFFLDKREFSELLVQRNSGPAPSMWYSEHDVVKPGSITVKWRIVCSNGAKADDDQDQGHDHDRSGDQEKYKHHKEDFHGYNDDEPSSYDQGDS
jgi:hypothetical protein